MSGRREDFGPDNPAKTHAEALKRFRFWANSAACEWCNIWEIAGWTREEYHHYDKTKELPKRFASGQAYAEGLQD